AEVAGGAEGEIAPEGEKTATHGNRNIRPVPVEFAANQAGGSGNANRHCDQQQSRHDEKGRERLLIEADREQGVMNAVKRPSQLPGAEIRCPALLVQIREDEEKQ